MPLLRQEASNASLGGIEKAKVRYTDFSVALVSMPFVTAFSPSIQIGLLKSIAESHGFPCEAFHLYIDFARKVGVETYEILSNYRGHHFSEWLFSAEAFQEEDADKNKTLLHDFSDTIECDLCNLGDQPKSKLLDLRENVVPEFLNDLMQSIPWANFKVVGFTSTFQQNISSFSLARRIKQKYPEIIIVFGGANFDGEMGKEFLDNLDFIDYAFAGEADQSFPSFLNTIRTGGDVNKIDGLLSKSFLNPAKTNKIILDSLPVPDYRDYFERIGGLQGFNPNLIRLPVESSRGCWWGEKQHCIFCGLNSTSMKFRSKSPEVFNEELKMLSSQYALKRFDLVDNILDMNYFKTIIPNLIKEKNDFDIFYEVKANLTIDQISMLSSSGIRKIQPGIESLSSHVLQLMRKGATSIQNINTLRWCLFFNIDVFWNILWGFPGETEADYELQERLVPKIKHLPPPASASRIWMERFSPIFNDRDTFKTKAMAPERSYNYVYPHKIDLNKTAYFFDYEFIESLPDSAYVNFAQTINSWTRDWIKGRKPVLSYQYSNDRLTIIDSRYVEVGRYTFKDELAKIYLACSQIPTTVTAIKQTASISWSDEEILFTLSKFCQRNLMIQEDDKYLSLAIPEHRN